ncbi:MAG: hypothetical protein O3C57_02010 [Verrucomicrobia bacterium]|nr:hypothetical protein [Verrucomicrobiota bacterium]
MQTVARRETRAEHGQRRGTAMVALWLCVSVMGSGCATSALPAARSNYFLGRYDLANQSLTEEPASDKDRVLFLMERGMIRQSAGRYTDSVHDWLDAHLLADKLDYYSVSKGSASLLINDSVLAFRGMSYERALLHAFSSKSYFALGLWGDAAVEARNNIYRLERRGKYPDDPYCRYMNGFCLELTGDHDGARLQYSMVNELLGTSVVDTTSGRFLADPSAQEDVAAGETHEMVCFIGIGRPSYASGAEQDRWRWGTAPYARLYSKDGTYLGRSHPMNTTDHLATQALAVHATMRAVKTATRVVVKEIASGMVGNEDPLTGQLLRLFLFSLERPDTRRWQTLPEWLQVARVRCPADMVEFTVEYLGMDGRMVKRQVVRDPITRKDDTYVSFCRAF